MPKCLFVINGLGLGNSTRCHAIAERILQAGVEVHLVASGNSALFFSGRPEFKSLRIAPSFENPYADKPFRLSAILKCAARFWRVLVGKHRVVNEALKAIKPDLVITDSDYCVLPVLWRRIPLIGINNADFVVSEYIRRGGAPKSVRAQFWLLEFPDFLFHLLFYRIIISPRFDNLQSTVKWKYRYVGPISRKHIDDIRRCGTKRKATTKQGRHIVCMLSGVSEGRVEFLRPLDAPDRLSVVGACGESSPTLRFLGKLKDNTTVLESADILVINAGFSAACEAIALGKPTFVMPIEAHAEQYINALHLQERIGARLSTRETIAEDLCEYLKSNMSTPATPSPNGVADGAGQAAEIILSVLKATRAA